MNVKLFDRYVISSLIYYTFFNMNPIKFLIFRDLDFPTSFIML
jgi:hypothetical protein